MTRARLKTEAQDVWHHIGIERPTWVLACTEWRDDDLYLIRGADKQRVERGDYLVRDLDGAPLWMTADQFNRDYEVII